MHPMWFVRRVWSMVWLVLWGNLWKEPNKRVLLDSSKVGPMNINFLMSLLPAHTDLCSFRCWQRSGRSFHSTCQWSGRLCQQFFWGHPQVGPSTSHITLLSLISFCLLFFFRAAEMSDEVRRQRPPRFIHKDRIVRPYLFKEAEGNDILQVGSLPPTPFLCDFFNLMTQ